MNKLNKETIESKISKLQEEQKSLESQGNAAGQAKTQAEQTLAELTKKHLEITAKIEALKELITEQPKVAVAQPRTKSTATPMT